MLSCMILYRSWWEDLEEVPVKLLRAGASHLVIGYLPPVVYAISILIYGIRCVIYGRYTTLIICTLSGMNIQARCPCKITHRSLWEDLVLHSRACMKVIRGCSWGALFFEDLVRFWRSFEIPLDVLVWGSGMRSWWVDIALLLVPQFLLL